MTILDEARLAAAGDAYQRIDVAKAAVRDRQQQVRGITHRDRALEGAITDVVSTLLDTGSVPDDFGSAAQRIRDAEDRNVQQQILVAADRALDVERAQVKLTTANEGLAWLNDRLSGLLDQIRAIPEEVVFSDASTAIAHGTKAVKAWTEMEQHAATYNELRDAQTALLADARGGIAGVHNEVYLVGLTVVPHDSHYLIATGEVTLSRVYGTAERTYLHPEPYPGAIHVAAGGGTTWPTTDRNGYLRWLAARGDAWVPTTRKMKDAVAARQAAIVRKVPMTELIGDKMHGDLVHLGRLDGQVSV